MPIEERTRALARQIRAFQESAARAGPAAAASYSLIGAIGLLGGIGYALDAWWGTRPVCLLTGLLLGVFLGLFLLAKTVWRR
jgi:F0F1-type ATP synthase assembly protein I